ncbi:MAG TPA: flagellar hook protein FlgE [bacterium]
MMRSLFSGVSGLKNQQFKMDVISNNISNINTVGFKASRINFAEELGQLIRGSQESLSGGAQNGMSIGLGVRTGSIERNFGQGILQTTGKETDLGIEGNGFFIVNDGSRQLFTRAGNFLFDGNGRLVTTNGATVQGWMADETGALSQTALLGDILFDANVISPAKATENAAISGNLDASVRPSRQVWTASRTFTVAATSQPADATALLNDLEQTTTPLVDGDTIIIGGSNFDGTPVNATFTYGAANDGTTVGDLLAVIDAAFSGTAALDNGRITLTDSTSGESDTTITLAAGAGNTGAIEVPGFLISSEGFSPKSSSSVEVYDSLGTKHTLNLMFTKTENDGEWRFEATLNGSEVINEGATGTLTFGPTGALETILYDNGQSLLIFDPANGAEEVQVNLDFENATGFSSMTQFAGLSSVIMPYQDGQANGQLTSFGVDERGRVVGSFSNGRNQLIAQIALAQINNPEGMTHVGENLYQLSGSTGIPAIGKAGEEISSIILAGTLEASNVDLAQEFAEMIIAQRSFQANARVITVADQFLNEVTQLKR